MAKPPKAKPRLLWLREVVAKLEGARLCYGEPVRVGERAVVPIARVSASGGGGWGSGVGSNDSGEGGGGGGHLEAVPVGFLDCGPDGARFERIPDPDATGRRLKAGAAAFATVLTAVAGAKVLRERGGAPGGVRGLLRR